jgi:hypothetical protein
MGRTVAGILASAAGSREACPKRLLPKNKRMHTMTGKCKETPAKLNFANIPQEPLVTLIFSFPSGSVTTANGHLPHPML